MSRIQVQCKGSGQQAGSAGFNTRRARCGGCGKMVDVFHSAGGPKFRKHLRTTTSARLRRGR